MSARWELGRGCVLDGSSREGLWVLDGSSREGLWVLDGSSREGLWGVRWMGAVGRGCGC